MNSKPLAHYLPHTAPMILLEELEQIDDSSITCSATVNNTGVLAPFLNDNGELPAYYFLEMMAQAIGVWNGYHAHESQEKPKIAFLLGSRAFNTNLPFAPAGANLKVIANLVLKDDNLANFEANMIVDDRKIASAKLNVYQPTEAETQIILQEKSKSI